MYPPLRAYIDGLSSTREVPAGRKEVLQELVNYLSHTHAPKLHFICTHNSRRSHLSQVWAQTMSYHFGVEVETFSGGTEATAFHPNAVAAIQRTGFIVNKQGKNNPTYEVSFAENNPPMRCYSKVFDAPPNPTSGFAAIMTCSEADAACPTVWGADRRIKLFYEDPKRSDGTPSEAATYDERCKQIASEMYFVFNSLPHAHTRTP